MISIICVYNNEALLNNCLLQSLKSQSVEYELILLNNTNNKFHSAAEALNEGGKRAHQKFFMFVHQDVDLSSPFFLENIEKKIDSIQQLGVAGVAGKKDSTGVFTIIQNSEPPIPAGKNPIDTILEVQTLDECLIIIPKTVFNTIGFDEGVCDNWHLYAVDYCLNVKKMGLKSYVIPVSIYHKSPLIPKSIIHILFSMGALPSGYYSTLKKVLYKHKNEIACIYTTCGDWSTSTPLIIQRINLFVNAFKKRIAN